MSFVRMFATTAGVTVVAAGLALLVPGPAMAAGDSAKEIATAAQHAGYAAQAKEMKMVQAHLQHTINCLVGPKGKGFDANQLNPCKDQGNGAIADTKDKAKKKDLQAALSKARAGLKAKTMATAQKDAAAAEASLKKASM